MKIVRKCPITEVVNTMEIPVTAEQIHAWQNGECIQNAMPDLSADQREFIKTGILPETWNKIFCGD